MSPQVRILMFVWYFGPFSAAAFRTAPGEGPALEEAVVVGLSGAWSSELETPDSGKKVLKDNKGLLMTINACERLLGPIRDYQGILGPTRSRDDQGLLGLIRTSLLLMVEILHDLTYTTRRPRFLIYKALQDSHHQPQDQAEDEKPRKQACTLWLQDKLLLENFRACE